MEAKLIGFKDLEFKSNDGEVKMRQYHVIYNDPTEIGLNGSMSGKINWNVLERGDAPNYKLGDSIPVQYNKNGRLTIVAA